MTLILGFGREKLKFADLEIDFPAERRKNMDSQHAFLLCFHSIHKLSIRRPDRVLELQGKSGMAKASPGFHRYEYTADQPNGCPLG